MSKSTLSAGQGYLKHCPRLQTALLHNYMLQRVQLPSDGRLYVACLQVCQQRCVWYIAQHTQRDCSAVIAAASAWVDTEHVCMSK